jgi:phosphatidylglycerophosphatase A
LLFAAAYFSGTLDKIIMPDSYFFRAFQIILKMGEGVLHSIVTGLGTGYLPAPGTCSSILLGIPLVIYFHRFLTLRNVSAAICIAMLLVHLALPQFSTLLGHDPQMIVVDEIVGMLCVFINIPLNITTLALGTALFRFFDITKLGLIGLAESLPGSLGIIADDVLAGIAAHIILRLIIMYTYR